MMLVMSVIHSQHSKYPHGSLKQSSAGLSPHDHPELEMLFNGLGSLIKYITSSRVERV